MLSKEQLEKIANQGPVDIGGAQNPIVTEMATELLSLREQLAELKALEPFGYIDAVHNWNYINLKSELNTVAFISKTPDGLIRPDYGMPLFTAAKPAED
ncbi:hypothetical protein [Yersinia enterocolitica]|uniref:hypothetical protein n=1 Tax=Yersinia enterocolitica TaxID=630 RepID=UPI002977EA50|nr:hypothetical protein [Yersinia enterocolitica]EKN5164354.1 hypothetical protein [Yersinia enterocolitica]EKN6076427.1 hypothetical protein [Yersinia enterocolitica]EKN6096835.1 hypothetical protein [Yersinia enterocolitica]HDL7891921.1 hypothetical protein [Yersinia enterocolitica]